MSVGQQKTGRRVIELAVRPGNRVMTIRARRGEPQRHVIHRRDCVVVVSLVAVHAGAAGDVVVAELRVMATAALQRGHSVGIRQRKSGSGVIKRRRNPGPGVVAGFASSGDSRGLMIWIRRALEILLVTRNAGVHGQGVVATVGRAVAVGARAWRYRMHASQRETHVIVIKSRGQRRPARRRVAIVAGR